MGLDSKKHEPEVFSDTVIARIGELVPICYKCGKKAEKIDGVWRCPQCDTKEDTKAESNIKDQDYYIRNGYRARDIIRDLIYYLNLDPWQSWVIGNVLKYICRYPFKGSWNDDLAKAQEYLEWLKIEED